MTKKSRLQRISLERGDSYRISSEDGAKGVYLVSGEVLPLVYGVPSEVPVGGHLQVLAQADSVIGVFYETDVDVSGVYVVPKPTYLVMEESAVDPVHVNYSSATE